LGEKLFFEGEVFWGGRYRGVFLGGDKVLGGKSPESRVQGPVQLLGYAIKNDGN